jgi:RecA/RadA recombinase
MRPIPAPRLGDTHGLLRAISSRDRVRLDEFITEFSIDELFPPGLENALGRTRQFVSFARSAGLLKEDRGVVELTEVGKRYVRSGDENAVFDVSSGQAEWLRRQLFERHMTDSIYHGVAIGLSLYASNPPDFHISRLDFGRALAHLGRAGWDNENTLESQGERYTTFLRDLELLDDQSQLTDIGNQTRSELTLPVHMSLRDLAGQLNPGGPEAAQAEGEAEWAAHAAAAAPEPEPEPEPAPEPGAEEPPAEEAPAAIDTGEYEDVAGAAAAAGRTEPSGRPIPPSDIWETAAPDEVTRAYSAISPEQAAAAAVDQPAESVPPPGMTSGDPLGQEPAAVESAAPDEVAEEPAAEEPVVEEVAFEEPAPEPVVEEVALEEPAVEEPVAEEPALQEPVAEEPALDEPAVEEPAVEEPALQEPVVEEPVPEEPALDEPVPEEPALDEPVAEEPVVDEPAADAPVPVVEVPADLVAEEPAAADGAGVLDVEAATAEAALAETDTERPATEPEPEEALADEAAAAAMAAGVAAPPPSAAEPAAAVPTRAPSGFLDFGAVKAAAEADGLRLPDSVYAGVCAALATGKHVVIAGPAGSGKTTLALAIAKAAVQAGRSEGAALATASPKWSAQDTVGRVHDDGFTQGHVLSAAGKKKWLVIDELDRAKLDKAFGDLSSFLGGLPLSLPDGSREVAAPKDWRIVATRDSSRGGGEASAALARRFAEIQLPRPDHGDLQSAIDAATEGDATAAAAVRRLLDDEDLDHLGAGTFLDAARYAAERNAIAPASEDELHAEIRAAFIDPQLREEDD